MKFYLVGTAEPILETSFLGGIKEREFSENDLVKNISQMDTIPFFDSQEEAIDYARSLRIQRPAKLFNPENIKFAPVIEIDCEDSSNLEAINQYNQQNLTINYKEYIDAITNFSALSSRNEIVSCRMVPKSNLNLTTIHINALLLPDSGRQLQTFSATPSCTLI